MICAFSTCLGAGLLAALPFGSPAADKFQLRDGDRVVWLGSTLVEREQRYGYWEAALTRRYAGKNITFRNLGWSGDTVFGEARAGFGSAAEGFRRLKEHVLSLKPTVLIVAYGFNESFQGQDGLAHFQQGLNTLLDTLAPAQARVVLLSPLREEDLGRPLPDPTAQNEKIRLYTEVLRKTAGQRRHHFVNLYELLGHGAKGNPPAPLTDNGIHLTAYGYWRATAALEKGLGDLQAATMWLMQNATTNPNNAGAAAYPYMNMMGVVSLGLMWLRMAKTSAAALTEGDADSAFHQNKLALASFYAARVMPETASLRAKVEAGAETLMAIPAEAF